MKFIHTTLSVIAIGAACCSMAQQQVASVPFEFSKETIKDNNYAACFLEDPAGKKLSYVLKNDHEVKYILFDEKFRVLKEWTFTSFANTPFEYDGAAVYKGIAEGDKHHYIFRVGNKDKTPFFVYHTIDFSTGKTSNQPLFTPRLKEKELTSYEVDGKYYHLSLIPKTDSLIVRTVSANGSVKEAAALIPKARFLPRDLFLDVMYTKFSVIPDENTTDFLLNREVRKIYGQPDVIHFVEGFSSSRVFVASLNLKDLSTQQQLIDLYKPVREFEQKNPGWYNTVLLDGKLFTLSAFNDRAELFIHDLSTGQLLNTIVVPKDYPFEKFAAPPIRRAQRGDDMKEFKLDNLKKLMKDMVITGTLSVKKNPAGFYELAFGTHISIPESNPSTHVYVPTTMFGAGTSPNSTYSYPTTAMVGGWRMPSMGALTYSPARYDETILLLAVDAKTFQPVTGKQPAPHKTDNLYNRVDDMPGSSEVVVAFRFNGKSYMGYYNKKSKTYVFELTK